MRLRQHWHSLTHHPNLTLRKLISFVTINGLGALILFVAQIPLVEVFGMNYILATAIAGGIAMMVKFILMGVITYRR